MVKVPRWAFEKFPGTPDRLGTTMQSVGEVMAIGRTFREAFQKALRSLELGLDGWESRTSGRTREELARDLTRPRQGRLADLHEAMRRGLEPEQLHRLTGIDPWFLDNLARLMEVEGRLRSYTLSELPDDLLREAKREGFSDRRIARLLQWDDGQAVAADESTTVRLRAALVLAARQAQGLRPVFRRVDTCAAEFPTDTPYLYSTWEDGPCESRPTDRRKVIVLGSGPNRIGQGIEFDTCCCHAVQALRADGIEAILVNCNPETVSTDYDLSDRLYFEPLRFEEVMHIIEVREARGRHRHPRRPDAARTWRATCTRPACGCWAPASRRSTAPRTAPAAAACWPTWTSPRRAPAAPATWTAACAVAAGTRLPGDGAAQLRAGRPRHARGVRRGRSCANGSPPRRSSAASTRCSSTSSWRTPSSSTSTPSATATTC